jgi:membrane protease subunit HflK
MTLQQPGLRWAGLPGRIRGMFNLNDPRWGRSDDAGQDSSRPTEGQQRPTPEQPPVPPASRPRGQGPNQGPPDLEELWRDFNRKLGGLLRGGKGRNGGPPGGGNNNNGSGGGGFQPEMKNIGKLLGIGAAVLFVLWLFTGVFIVQEGQQGVITQFGRYRNTVSAGLNWRLPYPIQRHELVFTSPIRSVDVGRDTIVRSTGLRESAMLTQDENIVEIKFAVQYRLNDARQYLFESRDPQASVVQAAESSVREVVGKMKMDSALAEERDQIAPRVRALMQSILDRYKVGIEIVGINLQQGGVRPPEQVQAAFDDVLKAGQERERAKNDAQAYANDVVPRAVGTASRLKEEADGYKARIVAQSQGDTQRFSAILAEYQRAPQVTRDRMYIETMQGIYSNVTKVIVDSKQGSNLLYLPLDKLMQAQSTTSTGTPAASATDTMAGSTATTPSAAVNAAPPPVYSSDVRTRDNERSRDRESR